MDFDLLKLFDHHGENTFASTQQRTLSYQKGLRYIKYLAARLAGQRIFGQKVMLSCRHTLDSQLLFLALLHTNDVVLVHPDHAESFLASMIKQHDINVVITDRYVKLPVKTTLLVCDLTRVSGIDLELGDTWRQWYAGHLSLLTSGTTGHPTMVTLDQKEIHQYGQLLLRYFDLEKNDCYYSITPFYHGFGLTRLISIITSGSSMYVPPTGKKKDLLKDINQQRCTWVSMIPRMVRIANRSSLRLWTGFRFATCSAAMISKDTLIDFQTITGRPIYQEYGCTEASIITSNTFQHNKPGSMGKTFDDQCQIIDQQVVVKPAYNLDRGWVATGDMGYIDSNGFLWLQGRSKEIIKKNGASIFPFEIECVFEKIQGIHEVVAFSLNMLEENESIGLAYVGDHDRQYMQSLCRRLLPLSRQPSLITRFEEIPLACGKISRNKLEQYVTTQQQLTH